jgi:hypothetical protein
MRRWAVTAVTVAGISVMDKCWKDILAEEVVRRRGYSSGVDRAMLEANVCRRSGCDCVCGWRSLEKAKVRDGGDFMRKFPG